MPLQHAEIGHCSHHNKAKIMVDIRQHSGPINRADVLTYALGSFGTGVFSAVPSVLLLYFCTETLHIAAAVAGAIMLIPKLWSIIWDPLVGNWSDRSRHQWGRRRPFMIVGNVGMVLSFVLLFSGPILSPFATVLWVGAAYFALATLYSLFAVPYIAIPAQVSPDHASLSRLVSARMMTSMVGILVGAAGAPLLVSWGGGGRDGYALMGWVIAGACFVIMAAPVFMMRDRDRAAEASGTSDTKPASLFSDMRAVWANRGFRRLALAYLAQATSFGAFSAIVPYLVTKGFARAESDIGTALGIYLVATIIAVPFWSWLGKRIGLIAALICSVMTYGICTVALGISVLVQIEWSSALIGFACAGITFAGLQVLPFTMVGEVIRTSGAGAEGCFTGVWTAAEKLGLSLGPASAGMVLSIVGTNNVGGIGLFVCIMPPVCILLTMVALRTKVN
jgi:glycoside/pentoside/hexuronide:cation symporter, GPH family